MTPEKIEQRTQNPWLWVVLVLTLGLTVWMANQPSQHEDAADLLVNNDGLPSPIIKKITDNVPTQATPQTNKTDAWQVRNREPLEDKPQDLFPVHSWAVMAPVQKQTQITEIPPPVAPPAPFAYVGKIEDGPKGTMIFLMGRNKLYTTAIGEKVDAMWRLDGEDINALKFTFLPLNLPQTLLKSQPLLSPDVATSAVD